MVEQTETKKSLQEKENMMTIKTEKMKITLIEEKHKAMK